VIPKEKKIQQEKEIDTPWARIQEWRVVLL